jgi:hypothetical protein
MATVINLNNPNNIPSAATSQSILTLLESNITEVTIGGVKVLEIKQAFINGANYVTFSSNLDSVALSYLIDSLTKIPLVDAPAGSGITAYTINVSNSTNTMATADGSTTEIPLSNFRGDTTYNIDVVGKDATNAIVASSSLTLLTVPSIPLLVSASLITANSCRISWKTPAISTASLSKVSFFINDGVAAERKVEATKDELAGIKRWTITGLTTGTNYTIEMTATNASGESFRSAKVSVTTL